VVVDVWEETVVIRKEEASTRARSRAKGIPNLLES